MSASWGYEWEDRNVKLLCGGVMLTGASSVIGVMVVGGADSVRVGDAVLACLDTEDNRVALCDL